MTPSQKAKLAFDEYAGMDAPEVPTNLIELSGLQVRLCRWQVRNFGSSCIKDITLGVSEESGELSHAVLKHRQGIRGMENRDAFLDAAGDAIADCAIYLMQAATALRLDFPTLLAATASEVMKRDWVGNPNGEGACVDCGEQPGARSYDDVPGKGTLCLPCHEKWKASVFNRPGKEHGNG